MNKLLVICGPTATGKTALGIKLAKKYSAKVGGEIVSADSRQIYRYMNIGTGKDIPKIFNFQFTIFKQIKKNKLKIGYYLVKGVKVWLYDIVKPDEKFSVADYVQCASLAIKDIWMRKKIPIIVGGTGFYIKGLIDGYETIGVEQDWKLRGILGYYDTKILREKLRKLDPQRLRGMNRSDRNNPRRLIRAIEIAMANRKPATQKAQKENKRHKDFDLLMIGLRIDYQELYRRIDKRVEERVRQGIVKEIKALLKKGYSWENSVLGTTIGYREWQDYLRNPKLKEEIIKKWKFSEHAYARRQMTWFKKVLREAQDAYWFDISKKSWQDRVEKLVKNWYSKK